MAALTPAEIAALDPDEFGRLSAGMAIARARYDGMRRNALYAIGSARDRGAQDVVKRLVDDPDASVRDAAAWALDRLNRA
jgi:epoxyqueuosine reductase